MQVGRCVTGDKCWYVCTHTDQSVNFQIKPTRKPTTLHNPFRFNSTNSIQYSSSYQLQTLASSRQPLESYYSSIRPIFQASFGYSSTSITPETTPCCRSPQLVHNNNKMPPEDQDDGVVIPPAPADTVEDFTVSIRSHRIPTVRSVQLEIRKLVSIYQS